MKTSWPLWGIRKGNELRTAVTLGEGLWLWRMQDMARHDGMAVKDVIGYTIDGSAISNTKLEAVRWRRFEHLLSERGVRMKVPSAHLRRLRKRLCSV